MPAQSDVVGPLHAADVVVVPSVWAEPFGRVIVEAMATGRPALASRIGGITEILTGEFERFLVEPGDAGVVTLALESLVGWQKREPSLADHCRAHVRDHFSLDRVVDGVERSLTAPLEGHHRALLCAADIAATSPSLDMAARLAPAVPVRDGSRYRKARWRALVDCSVARSVLGWQPVHTWAARERVDEQLA